MLKKDSLWHVFLLRAVVTLQDRVTSQLVELRASEEYVQERCWHAGDPVIRAYVRDIAIKLRELETDFLENGSRDLETMKLQLLELDTVKAYLGKGTPGIDITEDFS